MVEELHRLGEEDVRTAIESLAMEQLLPNSLAEEAKRIRA